MTFWLKIRSLTLVTAVSGLDVSSSMMMRIGRPLNPPLALMVFSASSRPLRSLTPRPAPTPVTDTTEPNLIGSPEVACARADA